MHRGKVESLTVAPVAHVSMRCDTVPAGMIRDSSRCILVALLIVMALGCEHGAATRSVAGPHILVLGIAQDGGFPQAGCKHQACRQARLDPSRARHVTSLAIVDSPERWLIDVTPDFPRQLELLDRVDPTTETLR